MGRLQASTRAGPASGAPVSAMGRRVCTHGRASAESGQQHCSSRTGACDHTVSPVLGGPHARVIFGERASVAAAQQQVTQAGEPEVVGLDPEAVLFLLRACGVCVCVCCARVRVRVCACVCVRDDDDGDGGGGGGGGGGDACSRASSCGAILSPRRRYARMTAKSRPSRSMKKEPSSSECRACRPLNITSRKDPGHL